MQTSAVAYPRGLPQELYDEIIGFLWNDIPSLKACALANRIMTRPSQKCLFYCIALRAPLQKLNNNRRIFDSGLCGTSYNFRQMLLRSPHIAKYVVSLHIVDHWDDYQSNLETLGHEMNLGFFTFLIRPGRCHKSTCSLSIHCHFPQMAEYILADYGSFSLGGCCTGSATLLINPGHCKACLPFMIPPSDPSEAMVAITPAPRGSMTLALVVHLEALAGR